MRAILFFCLAASATSQTPAVKKLYFLQDESRHQWCAYSNESAWRSQIEPVRALIVGGMDYSDAHLVLIHVTEEDDSGDWAVFDEYSIDKNGQIFQLKRKINIIPESLSEETTFTIEGGKITNQHTSRTDLETHKPTKNSADWFHASPPVTRIEQFPFAALLAKNREIEASGRVCIPDSERRN